MEYPGTIKGVLFDVDGTLYHHFPVRLLMGVSLVISNLVAPLKLVEQLRIINTYRQVQEVLRTSDPDMAHKSQIELTAHNLKMPVHCVRGVVEEWMQRRPLAYIRLCRRKGVQRVVEALHNSGIKMGVYSDYPSHEKLRALGILRYMSTVVCSSDSDILRFKPAPDGFIAAAQKMQLAPSEILYIGDREDIDIPGARRAGMQVAIIKSWLHRKQPCGIYCTIGSLKELVTHCNFAAFR